ncbi:serine-tRNA ligase [Schizosaccharomyces japonicus yFS275]|uniref:serine--tRNA ligase n=1 Tax=Schizosaccharomyces japonicus (strain yFS275 / FY16936) TaxID=402676 RepID=B6K2Z8_SCHJY|nr:serine-tRNA ligase [Schizosaccharomyces japonicus yFS275]EEB07855.1 serine-tRNA ligase [Schizosaccharomyces japonicus yFS275]
MRLVFSPCLRRTNFVSLRYVSSKANGFLTKRVQLDYKKIVENAENLKKNCLMRNMKSLADSVPNIVRLYHERIQCLDELKPFRAQKNTVTKQLADKNLPPTRRHALLIESRKMKEIMSPSEKKLVLLEQQLQQLCLQLPNQLGEYVPIGPESDARCVGYICEDKLAQVQQRTYVADHLDIAKRAFDFDSAALGSGHSFVYQWGDAALLEFALLNFTVDYAIQQGWEFCLVPTIVRTDVARACGFQPRDAEGQQMYELESDVSSNVPPQVLVGTAEVSLAASALNKTFTDLKKKCVIGVSRAYRREAGAHGKFTRGMYRLHEFTKAEFFAWTHPDYSSAMLKEIIKLQATIIQMLEIPARILYMPSEELGASASEKYDIEAWMPSRNDFGEITSASNCLDYQARRLWTRYDNGMDTGYVHTLNGTAVAIPRLSIAILENNLQSDGRVKIPNVLQPFMNKKYLDFSAYK